MSERYDADPNQTERGADNPHCSRYLLARGFTTKDDVVVDGACGRGYGSCLLSQIAKKVISIDKDLTFSGKWARENIDFRQINFEEDVILPECDVWVSFETIEHLENPQDFMDRVTTSTKKIIIFSSPNMPTKHEHSFHKTDVLKNDFKTLMNKYKDWIPYHSFIQGYHWIAIYIKKGAKLI